MIRIGQRGDVLETLARQQLLPLLGVEQRMARSQFLVGKFPPAVGDAEDHVQPSRTPGDFQEHEQTAWREKLACARETLREISGGVEDVGGDQNIRRMRWKNPRRDIALEVQRHGSEAGCLPEFALRRGDKKRRDVW